MRVQRIVTIFALVAMLISRLGYVPVSADDVVSPADPVITTTPDGTNGGDPTPVAPGDGADGSADGMDTTITSGNATATLATTNTINTNILGVIPLDDATTTTDALGTDVASGTSTIASDTTNNAQLENNGTADAATGANVASSTGNAIIVTGDAVAQASVLNVVNTNIFNSSGFVAFLSNLFGNFDAVDLRSLPIYSDDKAQGNSCTLFGCGNIWNLNTSVTSSSTANIFNNIFVRAFSGGNMASTSEMGNGTIETGNAYAAANIVNVANTNIVDSNYMMLVFNNFGDWNGDFIFPGKEYFENEFLGQASSTEASTPIVTSSTSFINNNAAEVSTSATTTASSGDNSAATGDDSALIVSGNSNSTSNVLNRVNHNMFGGTSMAVIFRVHGNWNGNVYSLPPGVNWSETPGGIAFWSDGSGAAGFAAPQSNEQLVAVDASAGGATVSTDVANTNFAAIKNNVEVYALTGDNKVATDGGQSTIKTGNAYAGSNVVNVANTNLFGTNWILAIIDIFGDWKGNIAFGRPDLWIGGWIESKRNPLEPNDELAYHFTVANRGDTDATNVELTGHIDDHIVYVGDGGTWGRDGITWNLGTIRAGQSVDVTYRGNVRQHIPFGTTAFESSASVSAHEPDANPNDNTEKIGSLVAFHQPPQTGPAGIYYTTMPKLQIVKTNSATTTVKAPGAVDYKVTILNDSTGSAYHSTLYDTLKDQNGVVVSEQTWALDEILPNEEITVTYSVEFNGSSTSGVYTNYAHVKAYGGHSSYEYGTVANSPVATSTVTIDGISPAQGEHSPGANATTVTAQTGGGTNGGVGGIGNGAEENNSSGVASHASGVSRGIGRGSSLNGTGGRLSKVVELHPLAVSMPGENKGGIAGSLWGNQSAAAFSALLGSPYLYGVLVLILGFIIWFEKRKESV